MTAVILAMASVCSAKITLYLQNIFTNFCCKYIKFLHFRRHIRNKNLAKDAINSKDAIIVLLRI
jgi:hypothetical protein